MIGKKLLANRDSDGNAVKISSTVPRKPRKTPKEEGATAAPAKKATSAKASKPRKKPTPASASPPTDEEIQLRAYFIAERRHRLNLPGDASSDWLEARRQLLAGDAVK
jgi:hypothetical protein